LKEQILSYKTLFRDVVATIGYALSPAMNRNLHAALVEICTSGVALGFTARTTALLPGKCCPHSPSFIRPKAPNPDYTVGVVRQSGQD
jgi:hypothetical protein